MQLRKTLCEFLHNFQDMRDIIVILTVYQRVEIRLQRLLVQALYEVYVSLLVCKLVDKLDHHLLPVAGL